MMLDSFLRLIKSHHGMKKFYTVDKIFSHTFLYPKTYIESKKCMLEK